MQIASKVVFTIIISLFLFASFGCTKAASSNSNTTSGSDSGGSNGGGSGGSNAITNAELSGSNYWASSCVPATEPVTNADHTYFEFSFNPSSNSFDFTQYWFTGTCTGANYALIYGTSGTYAIGSLISGSSTTYSITFTLVGGLNGSPDQYGTSFMPFTTTVQTAFNNACGGTSPFQGSGSVSSSNDGGHFSYYGGLDCMNITYPNSSNNVVSNVIEYSGGQFIVGAVSPSVPGSLTTAPASATITLTGQSSP